MRQVLTILLIAGAIWLGLKFKSYFNTEMKKAEVQTDGRPQTAPGKLPGMTAELEPSYETARNSGAAAIREWLNKHIEQVEDPRRADIQLDYVLAVSRTDAAEAKRVLQLIKQRVGADSPVNKRLQQIESTLP